MKPAILIAAVLLGVVPPAVAQNVDARWAPFIGCWDIADGGATTCVAPTSPAGIVLTTRVDGQAGPRTDDRRRRRRSRGY